MSTYVELLDYWREELSDPTSTGRDWTPEQVEEEAIAQLVYGAVTTLVETHGEETYEFLRSGFSDKELDDFCNNHVERYKSES